jgi:hypothetical protein
VATLLGGGANSNLAGSLAGSGPRIQQNGNKIIIAVQNQDVALGGESVAGTATAIICQKPTTGNIIASGSCQRFVLNSEAQSGQFPGLTTSSSKVILTSTDQNHRLLTAICDYDSTSATTTASTLNTSSCGKSAITLAQGGWYSSVAFDGTKVVVASYDEPVSVPYGLRITVCTVESNNSVSNCNSNLVDNALLTDGVSLYPGVYPSLILKDNTFYVAHQLGKTQSMRLRLSSCTIAADNTLSNCSNQSVTTTAGSGATPRITIAGNNSSGQLWLTGVTLQTPTDNASESKVGVYRCDLPLTSTNCSAVAPYFMQSASLGWGPIYSRSAYIDPVNQLLIIPFSAFYSTHERKNGVINLGLPSLP